jgi:hypothetical protein
MIIKEKEIKLLVNSEGGLSVLNYLKKTSEMGNFIFSEERKKILIVDVYFDTDNLMLNKNNQYLRMRSKNGQHFITFSQKIKNHSGDNVVDEITHPLDDAGVNLILNTLNHAQKDLNSPDYSLPNFVEILESIGLREQLRVRIDRIERKLLLEGIEIGKLKLDNFKFLFQKDIGYFEIEIDFYKKIFSEFVNMFIEHLQTKFKYRLEISNISKYKRGLKLLKITYSKLS